MYFKKLVGNKIYLSPMDKNDYLKYTEWVNDMEVAIGMIFSHKLIDEESERSILERLTKSEFNFAVIAKDTEKVIGNVGFPDIDYISRTAEAGIFIGDKSYRGNGVGQETLALLLDFGFNVLNLNNIYLRVYSYNKPAIGCYTKVGFKEAGKLRQAKIIAGVKYDVIYMDILAEEFKSPYIQSVLQTKMNS